MFCTFRENATHVYIMGLEGLVHIAAAQGSNKANILRVTDQRQMEWKCGFLLRQDNPGGRGAGVRQQQNSNRAVFKVPEHDTTRGATKSSRQWEAQQWQKCSRPVETRARQRQDGKGMRLSQYVNRVSNTIPEQCAVDRRSRRTPAPMDQRKVLAKQERMVTQRVRVGRSASVENDANDDKKNVVRQEIPWPPHQCRSRNGWERTRGKYW